MSTSNLKIIVLPLPAHGHMNPVLSVLKEFSQTAKNAEMHVYSNESFRKKIEENGGVYRDLNNFTSEGVEQSLDKGDSKVRALTTLSDQFLKLVDENMERLTSEIEKENPVIIMHDNIANYAKWVMRYLRARIEKHVSPLKKMPIVVSYHTTFVFMKNVYPSNEQIASLMKLGFFEKIQMGFASIGVISKCKDLAKKYGVEYVSPLDDFMHTDTSIKNVAFVLPLLQPKEHVLSNHVTFAGPCITEGDHLINLNKINDDGLKVFLQQFQPRNPCRELPKQNDKFLIYISLGSLFRSSVEFYSKFIDVIKRLNENHKNVYGIINVGAKCMELFNKESKEIPDNIKLLPFAPQLEILKRAAIFVTHCGMNSTSESVYFGIPMICIPASAEQPLVADHLADELGLGKKFNIDNVEANALFSAFEQVFDDKALKRRCFDYSLLSKEHDGKKATCEFLNGLMA